MLDFHRLAKASWLLTAGLIGGAMSAAVHAAEGIPIETWPSAWFAPPKTASQLGIEDFQSPPSLTAQVKSGLLPPVKQRLPHDPIVIFPFQRVGQHGGTARVFAVDASLLIGLEPPLIMGPAVHKILPNLARGWQYHRDGRQFVLYLRAGVKWSDGYPLTAADYLFWFNHILMNDELTPVREPKWQGAEATQRDELTVSFTFAKPHPFFVNELAHHGTEFLAPIHFLKDFHPEFVHRETLIKQARREGYISWTNYFNAVRRESGSDVFGTPTLKAFILASKSPAFLKYTRNPYYPKIDPEGNQLPYIDQIEAQDVRNTEVMAAKAATGQVHFAAISLKTSDIPLYKLGQKHHDFKAHIWHRLHGVDVVIQPNLTCQDLSLRRIFQDIRFRQALSLALNRDEINQIVYFGHGTPRQTTVIPSSKFYVDTFAQAFVRHEPETARRLLDEMDLRDRNRDGMRQRPDGRPLDITLEWVSLETPKGITMELAVEYWRNVGLDIRLRQIDGALQGTRARANLMQMTLWHADRTSDILFPPEPFWFVPMHNSWEECHWALWSDWYLSGGVRGELPPPKIMDLINWWDEMRTTMDDQRRVALARNILRSQAENLWTIGTVGLAPQPVVVSNKLRNVPTKGYWGWDNRFTLPYHPATWYLDGD